MTEMHIDGIYDLSTIWKFAEEVFPYFKERMLDWDVVYKEYLSRIFCINSEKELHLLLAEFVNLLGDGHTDYRFPEKLIAESGVLPFRLVFREGRWFIGETVEELKELLGTEILEINGTRVQDIIKQCFRYIYHVGDYASPESVERILPFFLKKSANWILTPLGMLSFNLEEENPSMISFKRDKKDRGEEGSDNFYHCCGTKLEMRIYPKILYARIDNFLNSDAAQEIFSALSQGTSNADKTFAGVIFDLRNNIGGMTAYAAKVAELFIPGEFHAYQKKIRQISGVDLASASQYLRMSEKKIEKLIRDGLCEPEEVKRCFEMAKNQYYFTYVDSFGAPGQKAFYNGSVIILTSRGTISAAEDFTAMFKSTKRAILMGTPTLGTTGTPLIKRLRLGGFLRICSVGHRLFDGTEFIGKGILPDLLVEETGEDYLCGKDTVLEKALEYLSEEKIKEGQK